MVLDSECCGRPSLEGSTCSGVSTNVHKIIRGEVCTRSTSVADWGEGENTKGWATCCVPQTTSQSVIDALPACSTGTADRCRYVDHKVEVDPNLIYILLVFGWFIVLPCHCFVICLGTRRHGYCGGRDNSGIVAPIVMVPTAAAAYVVSGEPKELDE